MTPPAARRYDERGWLSSRTFELHTDTILVEGYGLMARRKLWATRLRLADLDPEVASRSWVRRQDQHTVVFGVTVVLSLLGLVPLVVAADGRSDWWSRALWCMFGGMAAAGVFAVLDPRRGEYTVFNHAGTGQPLLSIGNMGAGRAEYEEFVAAVTAAIQAARSTGSPGAG